MLNKYENSNTGNTEKSDKNNKKHTKSVYFKNMKPHSRRTKGIVILAYVYHVT